MTKDIFGGENEIKANWIKWGKIGNKVFGTLVGVREMKSQMPGKEGQMVKIYELLTEDGEFNDIVDKVVSAEVTKINKGETWLVGGGPGLDNAMRNIKVGQIIGIKFTEEKPPKQKGFNPIKVKKVYTEGKMNEEWLKEQNGPGPSADGTQW
jgi:hypothetical protein